MAATPLGFGEHFQTVSVGHTSIVIGNRPFQALFRYEALKVTRHQFRIAVESFEEKLHF